MDPMTIDDQGLPDPGLPERTGDPLLDAVLDVARHAFRHGERWWAGSKDEIAGAFEATLGALARVQELVAAERRRAGAD